MNKDEQPQEQSILDQLAWIDRAIDGVEEILIFNGFDPQTKTWKKLNEQTDRTSPNNPRSILDE